MRLYRNENLIHAPSTDFVEMVAIFDSFSFIILGNLFSEAESIAHRSSNLQARIDRIAIRVTQLDSTVEEGKY